MALQNFIKTVWISNIMRALKTVHVFASVANTDYQGSLKNLGDQVKIMMIGDITAKAYSKDADIDAPEDLQDAASNLVADQPYYFNFKANDVEAVQEKPALLREATDRASWAFRDAVDQFFAGLYATAGLHSYSTGTTPWDVNSANVEDVLLAANEAMNEKDIPKDGRFLIIPPWFETKLIYAGLATKTSNDALYLNGNIGKVLNFNMKVSNNVSATDPATGDHTKILGGVDRLSFSFAGVISSIEAYRPEKRFEDAVKGLYLFGGKILRPDMTICIHADKTAEA